MKNLFPVLVDLCDCQGNLYTTKGIAVTLKSLLSEALSEATAYHNSFSVVQVMNRDGAANPFAGTVLITKPSTACAITLVQPISGSPNNGGQDGLAIRFVPVTVNAHTITTKAGGLNGNKYKLTMVPPSSALLVAYQGIWYVVPNTASTLS